MENFEKASKLKLRFSTNKGQLSVEELWDLSLESLNNIAKSVNRALKDDTEESFIEEKSPANTELQLKLDILKHIIKEKLAAKEAARLKSERSGKLATIKAMLANKQIEELGSKSSDELRKMVEELEASE